MMDKEYIYLPTLRSNYDSSECHLNVETGRNYYKTIRLLNKMKGQ